MYYVAYYTLPDDKRKSSPAANAKIPVIAKGFADSGNEVVILSTCSVAKDNERGFIKGRRFTLFDKVDCVQFSTYATKNGFLRHLLYWRANIKLFFKLLKVKKDEVVCFYNAIERISVIRLVKKIKKFKLILEVEEIYANASKLSEKEKSLEQKIFKDADAYIFSTELLNTAINTLNKPYAIIYGTYKVEDEISKRIDDGRIHCVYAGTFNKLKGGCFAAVSAAEFLDHKYHVHIIGFGSKQEEQELVDQIHSISKKTKCKISYDGLKAGTDYVSFLQSCHIGLSTQNSKESFNTTSFPSKVLSYLSNGLYVVSGKIDVLTESKVNDLIYYYETQDGRSIAEAIKNIDFSTKNVAKDKIKKLYGDFVFDLANVLEGIK